MDKKVTILYVRKSRIDEKGGQEGTLINQRSRLLAIAKSKGYENIKVIEEIESSIDENRPGLLQMKNMIHNNEVDRVLVTHQDRLARDFGIANKIFEWMIRFKVKLETPAGEMNLEETGSKIVFQISSILAEDEYDRIRTRMQIGKRDGVEFKHNWVHTVVPYGYVYNKNTKKLEVNEQEKKVFRKIVELALSGHSLYSISDKINDMGYTSKNGKMWNHAKIKSTLRSRARLGEITYKNDRIGADVRVKGAHEPLISYEEYNEIHRILSERVPYEKSPQTKGVKTPLDQLIFCAKCGRRLTTIKSVYRSGNWTWKISSCRRVDPDNGDKCDNSGTVLYVLWDMVWNEIMKHRDEMIEEVKKMNVKSVDDKKKEIKNRIIEEEKNLSIQEEKEEKLLDMYLNDHVSEELFIKRNRDIIKRKNFIKDELVTLSGMYHEMDDSKKRNKVEELIDKLDNFDDFNIEDQNIIMKSIIKRINYLREGDAFFNRDAPISIDIEFHD